MAKVGTQHSVTRQVYPCLQCLCLCMLRLLLRRLLYSLCACCNPKLLSSSSWVGSLHLGFGAWPVRGGARRVRRFFQAS